MDVPAVLALFLTNAFIFDLTFRTGTISSLAKYLSVRALTCTVVCAAQAINTYATVASAEYFANWAVRCAGAISVQCLTFRAVHNTSTIIMTRKPFDASAVSGFADEFVLS
jgi:predicted MarR family transcription regulator